MSTAKVRLAATLGVAASLLANVNAERMEEVLLQEPEIYAGEDALCPSVLPPNWKRVRDGGPLGFRDVYRSRCGLVVLMSVSKQQDDKWWLHVSFSRKSILPSYRDMREVKDLFIGRGKTALQVFPPETEHVNIHNYCLHLWHCLSGDVTPDFTRGTGSI